MWVLHITVVATNGLHLLSLTAEIIATAPRDGTKSRLFYADLVKFLNSPCMRGEENSGGAGEGGSCAMWIILIKSCSMQNK
jgi:hypothetical protein